MPIEVTLLVVVLALALVVGVPAIRLGIWLPRDLEFEVFSDDRLTEAQRAHFTRLDAAASTLAYFPRVTFSVVNMQGPTLSRVYLCDHDPAILAGHCLRGASVIDERHVSGQNYLEWITRYEDGTTLTTLNAEIAQVLDRMPHEVKQKCLGVRDPAALKALHDRRAEALAPRVYRSPHGRDMLGEYRVHHLRFCDYQVSRGLLTPVENGRHHVTVKTALRGVANFFNPLADNFTLSRLAAAVVIGVGLPMLGIWITGPEAGVRSADLPALLNTVYARWSGLAFAYALGGAAIGWLFSSKQFVWAVLLGYLPLRLLDAAAGPATLGALWMGFVAERVAAFRQRRELLV